MQNHDPSRPALADSIGKRDTDELDCFGATKPILVALFALWGSLMVMSALVTG